MKVKDLRSTVFFLGEAAVEFVLPLGGGGVCVGESRGSTSASGTGVLFMFGFVASIVCGRRFEKVFFVCLSRGGRHDILLDHFEQSEHYLVGSKT